MYGPMENRLQQLIISKLNDQTTENVGIISYIGRL